MGPRLGTVLARYGRGYLLRLRPSLRERMEAVVREAREWFGPETELRDVTPERVGAFLEAKHRTGGVAQTRCSRRSGNANGSSAGSCCVLWRRWWPPRTYQNAEDEQRREALDAAVGAVRSRVFAVLRAVRP